METPSFYRYYAESLDDETGFIHCEVVGNQVVRQVWQFGDNLYWASESGCKNEQHGFTDQPEWNNGDGAIDLVQTDIETFRLLWLNAGGPAC